MLDPSKVKILNDEDIQEEEEVATEKVILTESSEIVELSKQLHRQMLKLKGDFLQEDGTMKYPQLRESPDFEEFKKETKRLALVDLSVLNEDEKKAFFINTYNTLTVHALAQNVVKEKTVLQLNKFWQMYAYKIGDFVFSLDDIEHGVLRCNQLHPTYGEYFFKDEDPRRDFVMSELDPRIHFALNCGAKSCPPIRIFSDDMLDDQLDLVAKSFCQNDVSIDRVSKMLTLSKIFLWYGGDFGRDERSIAERIMPYFSSEQVSDFKKIRYHCKFIYRDYDWSIH